jgi:hypothetical protein
MDPVTLSLVLERRAEEIHEPEFAAYAPLVSFEAFLPAERVFGWVRLDADRLTDLLNVHDLIRLANVLVEDHRTGRAVSADETLIPRSEIIAVVARGPRGDPARRRATRAHAVVYRSGMYSIGGFVHAPVGLDAQERLQDGSPMIPLTDAWVEYRCGEQHRCHRSDTVIVNRELATTFELAGEPTDLTPRGPHQA